MGTTLSEKPWVANLDGGYESYHAEEAILKEAGYELRVFGGGRHDRAGKLAFAQGAAGVMVRWTDLDGPAFDAMPTVVHHCGAGSLRRAECLAPLRQAILECAPGAASSREVFPTDRRRPTETSGLALVWPSWAVGLNVDS